MTVQDVNHSKARFDEIYDQADPRAYFTVLGDLDYDIPQRAHPLFARVLQARTAAAARPSPVLDLGCSYGLNAALLRCDVTLQDLYDRYRDPAVADLTPDELAAADSVFFAERRRAADPRLAGLDVAGNALAYARRVGLLDDAWAEDLEQAEPSAGLTAGIADVGLITATGCVGYIGDKTFARLLGATSQASPPWVATFVLRMFSYDDIADVLAQHGLVTERLGGVTFRQRRFVSAEEQDSTLAALRARGLDAAGKEEDGYYHSDFFLSRPAEQVAALPLAQLLAGAVPTR
jgi:SAM-dependent methyltransferase